MTTNDRHHSRIISRPSTGTEAEQENGTTADDPRSRECRLMAPQGAYSDSRHVWHKRDGWHYLRASTGTTDRNPGTGENMADSWGPRRLLESCGLRMTGKALFDPLHHRSGGYSTVDDEFDAMMYCQSVEGWERVRDVVVHVFGNGQPVENFRWHDVGANCTASLLRRGWGAHIGRPRDAARLELEAFETRLSERLRDKPFVPGGGYEDREEAQAIWPT